MVQNVVHGLFGVSETLSSGLWGYNYIHNNTERVFVLLIIDIFIDVAK